jgi:hypothetical protein
MTRDAAEKIRDAMPQFSSSSSAFHVLAVTVHASICRVSQKTFVLLVGIGECVIEFSSSAFVEHDFSSYICNFL